MSRILLLTLASAVTLTVAFSTSSAYSQSECPKEEILIFGSVYGYSTSICNKSGKECSESASTTILFNRNKIRELGCADAPNCGSCASKTPMAAAKGNFVYHGRQIFLDTTDGVSKLESLQFAMVEGDKSDTHYAVFELSVAYNLKGKDPIYFTCPIALQLPGDPAIPGPLEAANKTVEGETHLIVTDPETKKDKSYKIVESRGNQGVIKTKLMRKLDKNPVPPTAKPTTKAKPTKPSPKRTPTPAKRKQVTPVEDK